MSKEASRSLSCPVCRQARSGRDLVPGELIHGPVAERIRQAAPGWSSQSPVCTACLNRFRAEHVARVLEEQRGELSSLDTQVVRSLQEHALVAQDVNRQFEGRLTVGERLADRVAEFGGSWRFVTIFTAVIAVWIAVNALALLVRPFDPYPFILLNLVLSCLAALQPPSS